MCDRLAPDADQSERVRVEEEEQYACQNCTQNRQSSAPATEITPRSIGNTAIRANHRISGSMRHRLQVLSGCASKLFSSKFRFYWWNHEWRVGNKKISQSLGRRRCGKYYSVVHDIIDSLKLSPPRRSIAFYYRN